MKATNIIVKDYLYNGNYVFGTFYELKKNKAGETEETYILDDGDVYSEKDLQDSGYEYLFVPSNDIIESFKKRFEEVKK